MKKTMYQTSYTAAKQSQDTPSSEEDAAICCSPTTTTTDPREERKGIVWSTGEVQDGDSINTQLYSWVFEDGQGGFPVAPTAGAVDTLVATDLSKFNKDSQSMYTYNHTENLDAWEQRGKYERFHLYSRLHWYFEKTCDRTPGSLALQCGNEKLTYVELDVLANKQAHFMRAFFDVGPGFRVCLLLRRSLDMYISLLATLKCSATFVPMDAAFPAERIAFIAQDSQSRLLLTTSDLTDLIGEVSCPVVLLDQMQTIIAKLPGFPLAPDPVITDDLGCYIIYTSGSTGKPKGVCINHSNICNFISVVVPLYGVSQADRVYQGITIAFDFSIEEIWPTFAVGASLIAGPTDHRKLGSGLGDFLEEAKITVMYCTPTLLSTLDCNLPRLRVLNVGGEACSDDLVKRWSSPGRTLLNTYGPTETTVTASVGRLAPDKRVTIGKGLPTYKLYILDNSMKPVSPGDVGEIWIEGKGVAKEYISRPDKTAAAFYHNFLDSHDSSHHSKLLFRTGDLGRLMPDGEIEMKGRIDDQVKIRGYRIELSEIEAVIKGKSPIPGCPVYYFILYI